MRWFVFLFCAVPLCFSAERVLYEQSTQTIIFQGKAISGEKLDERMAIERCRQVLSENNSRKLVVFTLVPDEHDATLNAIGCDHCEPYRFWRGQYDAFVKLKYPMAEMMVIENNAVLRYRSREGTVSEMVLSGSDPRPVSLGRFSGRIIHVSMQGLVSKPSLTLYVVGTGSIDSDAGTKYIAGFAHRMGVTDSTIQFRSDPWFINEIWRTWFPAFEEHRGNPPSEAEFKSTKTQDCLVWKTVYGSVTNKCSWEGLEVLR